MKAFKLDIQKDNTKTILTSILVAIFVLFIIYVFVWNNVKKQLIKFLNTNSVYCELKYNKLKVGGFPFILKSTVKDLEVKILYKNKHTSIVFDEVVIRNLIFTKNVNILFKGNAHINNNINNTRGTFFIGKHDVDFSLDEINKIGRIDTFIKNLTMEQYSSNDKLISKNVFDNLTVKFITIKDGDYENRTFRVNIDNIKTSTNDADLESNFEVIFSNIKEIKDGQLVKIRNVIDTFNFNDITNNFAININGNYEADAYVKMAMVDINGNISNYNYLISAINNNSSFLIDKNKVSTAVQVLELIPQNDKNTETDRYYNIRTNTSSKKVYVNDVEINEIVKQLLFGNDIE